MPKSPTSWEHSVKVLLDTHIAIWAIAGAASLPETARKIILDRDNEIYVSDISAWEIAIKSVARPGSIPFASGDFIEACEKSGYRFLPVLREAIVSYEELDYEAVGNAHRDPFDRLLIAQAKTSDMLFLTHDDVLRLYGEPHVIIV